MCRGFSDAKPLPSANGLRCLGGLETRRNWVTLPTRYIGNGTSEIYKNSLKSQSQLEKRAQSNSTTLFIIHIIY